MTVLFSAAFAASIPFAAAELAAGEAIVPDAAGWGVVLYTVLFPSIAAQALYVKGVALIGANRAGMFINMVPVSGALLSLLVLGEDFRTHHAAALLMVLCGIGLSELGGRRSLKAGRRGLDRA